MLKTDIYYCIRKIEKNITSQTVTTQIQNMQKYKTAVNNNIPLNLAYHIKYF